MGLSETDAATIIRNSPDPLKERGVSHVPKLTCKRVHRVYPPDPRDGLREVLYLDGDGEPMTAYLRDRHVASVCDGW